MFRIFEKKSEIISKSCWISFNLKQQRIKAYISQYVAVGLKLK